MAIANRCPVCGERIPRTPAGRRGPKLRFCIATEGACQEYAKAERALMRAQDLIIERTSSQNLARMQRRMAAHTSEHARDMRAELDAGMDGRRGAGRIRR